MPAVSPVPTPGSAPGVTPGSAPAPGNVPIESRGFDSLLEEADQIQTDTQSTQPGGQAQAGEAQAPADAGGPDALTQLAGIDSIHNASLRRIIADAAGSR